MFFQRYGKNRIAIRRFRQFADWRLIRLEFRQRNLLPALFIILVQCVEGLQYIRTEQNRSCCHRLKIGFAVQQNFHAFPAPQTDGIAPAPVNPKRRLIDGTSQRFRLTRKLRTRIAATQTT
ncbi:hypothetical protein C5Q97_00270 [Victivallales bacterium CCUG 44730]|nr:hypothetical protein C5Q97_00270 [Victivallales bacterium CCUG 44730]HBP05663.1 hypothetical protein [Lentisphaeria bacterium]